MDDFETALRNALDEEASTVTTSPGALQQIRHRIDRGDTGSVCRPRSPWLGTRGAIVATAAVAAAAAAAGVVFSTGGAPRHVKLPPAHLRTHHSGVPADFYAITRGATVDEYATASGRHLRRLTPLQSKVQLSDLQRSGGSLYFIKGGRTRCASTLNRLDPATGRTQVVATPDSGRQIVGYAIAGQNLALVENGCTQAQANALVVRNLATNASHTIAWQGNPPAITGDPVWVDGGKRLDLVWRGGMSASALQMDPWSAPNIQGTQLCGDPAILPEQIGAAGSRVFVAAKAAGKAIVAPCRTGQVRTAFKLPRGSLPGQLAVIPTAHGTAVLTTDANSGQVWLWRGHGRPHRVPVPGKIVAIAW